MRNFVSRHKRKFIVGGVLVAASTFGLRYAQRRLREFQEKSVNEFLEKTRRMQHFESTEKTCNSAIVGLLPGLCETVMKLLDTEEILNQLKSNPDNKMELWNELKVLAFARAAALVYGSSLLVTAIRVQLNVLGGYLYKDTTSTSETKVVTQEIQTMYSLLIIQYMMQDGINELVQIIQNNVGKILKKYSLKEKLTLSDIEQIFWSIQTAINKDVNQNIVRFIIKTKEGQEENDVMNKLLADTLDIYESLEFNDIYENVVNSSFSIVTDKIAEFYNPTPVNGKNTLDKMRGGGAVIEEIPNTTELTNGVDAMPDLVNINLISLPLAKLIPIINRLTVNIPSSNPNDFSKNLAGTLIGSQIGNQDCKLLGGNVYELYCQ